MHQQVEFQAFFINLFPGLWSPVSALIGKTRWYRVTMTASDLCNYLKRTSCSISWRAMT